MDQVWSASRTERSARVAIVSNSLAQADTRGATLVYPIRCTQWVAGFCSIKPLQRLNGGAPIALRPTLRDARHVSLALFAASREETHRTSTCALSIPDDPYERAPACE